MKRKMRHILRNFCLLLAVALFCANGFAQGFKAPENILPDDVLKALLNEISGQLPFNNEVLMGGIERVRGKEEFDGFFKEAEILAAKLKEYGLDEVRLETLGREDASRGGWWAGVDAELWIKDPEKRISRLSECPALMTRGCDDGEWEGEAVLLDRRDVPKLKDLDLKGKIILTEEYSGYFSQAFKQGALGVISCNTPGKPYYDPNLVHFDMRMDKGGVKEKVFSFNISRRQYDELRKMILDGAPLVFKAKAKSMNMPFKMDSVFAAIHGTSPDKKGLMFTAHLFERPAKIGANDNISGCVTLAEIARAITQLIKDGKIPRPERSIYFLMSEEGSGTMAFFKKYPEMAAKIHGDINMDMVGEDLDKSHAFFGIEKPTYNRVGFLESAAHNAAEYVHQTNIEKHSYMSQDPWMGFPVPIVEKNGTEQAFRYLMNSFDGGSDHGVFLDADVDIPALSFNVWPDFWYHTDGDRPDKSDPTQLKRVAFIGASAALAMSSGNETTIERLLRQVYDDQLGFIQNAYDRGTEEISALVKADGGVTFSNAEFYVNEAVTLSREALNRAKVLTEGKKGIDAYLAKAAANIEKVRAPYLSQLKDHYDMTAALKGFKAEIAKADPMIAQLKKIYPVKIAPLALGDRTPYMAVSGAFQKDQKMMMEIYQKLGFRYMMQLFHVADGTKNLEQIRQMMSLECAPWLPPTSSSMSRP